MLTAYFLLGLAFGSFRMARERDQRSFGAFVLNTLSWPLWVFLALVPLVVYLYMILSPDPHRGPPHHIVVNGENRPWRQSMISYEQLVALSGLQGTPTATYGNGPPSNPEGILSPGRKVRVRKEMVFDVVHTGNA